MSVHHALRTLVSRYGPGIIESGDLRATLDDFLEEGEATPGEINLLADAVRLGAYEQMLPMLDHGADPRTVVEAVGARLAANRGGDQQSASWACAALGFAVGKVSEELVLGYTSESPRQAGTQRVAAPPPPAEPQWRGEPTNVVGPPVQPPHSQPGPAEQQPASRSGLFVVALIAAGVLLAMVAAGAWIASRDGSAESAQDPTVTSTDESPGGATTPPESPDPPPTEEVTTPGDSGGTTDPPTQNGPLDVLAPFVNQECRNQILVVLASSGNPAEYESTIGDAVDTVPEAKYLRTDESCGSFNQEIDGNPIYAAYIGPFASIEEACQERYDSRVVGSYVRTVAADRETQDVCSCRDGLDQLPALEAAENLSYDVQQRVADLQTLLLYAGYDLGDYTSGEFDAELEAVVRDFQRDNTLVVDGQVGAQTWVTLLDACP